MRSQQSKEQGHTWASDIESIYQSFLLRDVLGYMFPGWIMIVAVLAMWRSPLLNFKSVDWMSTGLWLAASYTSGIFLRLFGTKPLCLLSVNDPAPFKVSSFLKWSKWFWQTNKETISGKASAYIFQGKLDRNIEREITFAHICGNVTIAIVLLYAIGFCKGFGGIALRLGVSKALLIWSLLPLALVFFFGHHRHVYQASLLRTNTRAKKKVERSQRSSIGGVIQPFKKISRKGSGSR